MRVAFLTTNLDPYAGWGRYSLEIVRRLPRLGIEPVVFTERGHAPDPVPGVEVHPLLHDHTAAMRNPLVSVQDMLAIRRLATGCAYVHCLAEPHLVTASLLVRRARPLLTTAVGTYAISILNGRWRLLYRRAYLAARVVPAISAYTGRRLAARLPAIADRIRTIPLGVDAPTGAPIPPAAAREPAFLAVGAVKRRKGTALIVEGLARVHAQFPAATLYIVGDLGDAAYVAEVKRTIATHGLERSVVFVGQASAAELAAIYTRVRGLVMPSLNHGKNFEGFGLVHLEANAVGVPAIGSLDCGNEDAIRDNESGFLIPQNNLDALGAAMAKLLVDDAEWDRLSASSLAFAREMSWERTADAYAALYRKPHA